MPRCSNCRPWAPARLLITGEGRAFCSGADLAGRGEAPAGGRGANTHRALTQHYNPTMLALAQLNLPVVAAVNGVAAGIGCSLALAADFTLAARSAYFLEAFVNIGLVPDGGTTWMLARQVGKARATEMMMLGERLPAEKAEAWGLIHAAVDDSRPDGPRACPGRTPGRRPHPCLRLDAPGPAARAMHKATRRR